MNRYIIMQEGREGSYKSCVMPFLSISSLSRPPPPLPSPSPPLPLSPLLSHITEPRICHFIVSVFFDVKLHYLLWVEHCAIHSAISPTIFSWALYQPRRILVSDLSLVNGWVFLSASFFSITLFLLLYSQLYLWGSPFWVRFLGMWPFGFFIQP